MLELSETKHSYYCSESNYYVNGRENYGRCDYETWDDFKLEWLGTDLSLDDDFNHLFRFDVIKVENEDDPSEIDFQLWMFFMLQRKGIFRPVCVRYLLESDMPEVEKFLKARWTYLQTQWTEFSGVIPENG